MRLVTFSSDDATPRLGTVLGPWDAWEGILDLHRADRRLPTDMLSFVDAAGGLTGTTWRRALQATSRAAKAATSRPSAAVVPAKRVRLHPPIRPRLLRDFIAFRGHIARTRASRGSTVPDEWDQLPAYYNGNHLNLLGPGARVPWQRHVLYDHGERQILETDQLDYEAELGFVVGREGRDIPTNRASRFLFGLTIFNDFSARDLQVIATKVGMGPPPAKDWANALGPCIVTRDEFGSLGPQRVVVRVNGEERLRGTYDELVHRNPFVEAGRRALWSFEDMVDVLSHGQGIRAGEVWGSGTIPGGCEFEKGVDARYLSPGDTVEIEVEGLGVLANTIGPRSRRSRG